jgi:hypothetical protein
MGHSATRHFRFRVLHAKVSFGKQPEPAFYSLGTSRLSVDCELANWENKLFDR